MSAVLATASPRRIKASHRRRRKVTSGRFVQRYYDPAIGRMLSVDPVTTNFNRYAYANNNPYKFTDPDGRNGVTALGGLLQETWNAASGEGFDGQNVMAALRDGYDGEGAGVAASAFDDVTSFVPAGTAVKAFRMGRTFLAAANASRKMENVRQLGKAGEAAAGIVKNTLRIPSMSGKAAFRIPDGLTSSTLTEVKNYSGKLGLTSQLKDFMNFAKETNRAFVLVVGADTKFTKGLQGAIDAGNIILKRLE